MPRTFSHEEYADMVYVYGYCNGNANAAVDEYRRRYPLRRTPNRAVFTNVFCALRECGTLPSVHVSSERRSIQTVEEQEEIVSMVQRSPTTSTRRIASRLRVPQSRVWRTLHYDGLYPFHHQPVQHLHPGDDAHRLQFCHWLSHNRELLPYILFTDEATFTRNGINNTRNCHNWAQDNPHATVQKNFQTRFSVNVWCGIINDMLIGPAIVEDRMTGDSYLHFLQNDLPEQLEDVPLETRRHMYLQHDGSPIHYTRMVTQHLNNTYPNRWIGRGSLIHWPARSPDLTPLDFCLWGWLKGEVYRTKVDTCADLVARINNACVRIKDRRHELRRTTRSTLQRVDKCIEVGGGIFENLL